MEHIKDRIKCYIKSLKENIDLMYENFDALDNIPKEDLEYMCDILFNEILENNNMLDRTMKDRYISIKSQFINYKNIKK